MKSTTVKALDHYDSLKAGRVYEVSVRGRFTRFTDVQTGDVVSLYHCQALHARLIGKLVDFDDTQSVAMHASIASSVCAHLPTKFIY
jgi:hypothetical protein